MKLAKPDLYRIVEAAHAEGVGPRALAKLTGYTHDHLSRIARRELGLSPLPRQPKVQPSAELRRLVDNSLVASSVRVRQYPTQARPPAGIGSSDA